VSVKRSGTSQNQPKLSFVRRKGSAFEETKQKLRQKLKINRVNTKSQASDSGYIIEESEINKFKTDQLRLPRFKQQIEQTQKMLCNKYKNVHSMGSRKERKAVDKLLVKERRAQSDESLEDVQNKKLRQAHFELKILKEELSKRNLEMLAITREIENYDKKRAGQLKQHEISNMKKKTSISPNSEWKLTLKNNRIVKQNINTELAVGDIKKLKTVPKCKIKPRAQIILRTSESLSVLNEETDQDLNDRQVTFR
jgi:hypothetical protein